MALSARFGDRVRRGAYWGGVVLFFGVIGTATVKLASSAEPPDPSSTGALVLGTHEVDPSRPPEEEARRLAREFAQGKVKLYAEGYQREVPRERLGLRLDQDEAVRLIRAWRDPESPMRRFRENSDIHGPAAVPVPAAFDFEAASRMLLRIKEELDRPVAEAYIDIAAKRVVPEKVGRRLNIYATAAKLERTARSEADEVKLVVVPVEPKTRAADLRDIDFDEVLGFFETRYNRAHKHRHRTYNLKLAAQSLQGQILMPGEEFSFNDVVGERSEANGYRVAPIIAAGQLVDGMGGGTCQVAGTLHAAAFFAGLEIIEREPHSRPSSYIRIGLDATVSYPNIDLKLRNPFTFPVVIGMSVEEGRVRAELLGPKRELTVTYLRTILETKEPPNRTIEDDSMPRGVKVTEQRGVPGFKIRRWRVIQKGTQMWREGSVDYYPPTPHIVKVGTNPALDPPEEPAEEPRPFPDPCPMRIVQGPGGLFDEQTACQ